MSVDGSRIARRNMEQLAGAIHMNASLGRGVRYARKEHVADSSKESAKNEARNRALSAFRAIARHESPATLSMPGLGWAFERGIVANFNARVHAIESDEAIYRASLKKMPSVAEGLEWIEANAWETHAFSTPAVARFARCEFHDMAAADSTEYAGAWLDFNGQLTATRMDAIRALWTRISDVMVVTLLAARTSMAPESELATLVSGSVVDVFRYQNGRSPMIQVTVVRAEVARVRYGASTSRRVSLPREDHRVIAWRKADNSPKVPGGAPYPDWDEE